MGLPVGADQAGGVDLEPAVGGRSQEDVLLQGAFTGEHALDQGGEVGMTADSWMLRPSGPRGVGPADPAPPGSAG